MRCLRGTILAGLLLYAIPGMTQTTVTTSGGTTNTIPVYAGSSTVGNSTLGYAMKGTDPARLTGAILGKALGNLESGKGVIEVLVSLQ
jgi:hypothetical protein